MRGRTRIYLSTWGKEIKKGMIDKDITVHEVALKLKVTDTYINMLIKGDRYDENMVRILSEMFGVVVPAGPAYTKCRREKISHESDSLDINAEP